MTRTLGFTFIVSLALFISACVSSPERAALSPQQLLSNSSEVVSFSVDGMDSVHTIRSWILEDAPSRVTLSCPGKTAACQQVYALLEEHHIPVQETFENTNKVSLMYDRINARNCPPQQFGCSVSVNAIQMTSDLNQFVNPGLSAPQDAATAVDKYNLYRSGL